MKRLEAQEGLISQWTFPGHRLQGDGTGGAALQLRGYMELLRQKVAAAERLRGESILKTCGRVKHRFLRHGGFIFILQGSWL